MFWRGGGGVVLCCFVLNHQFLYFDKAAFHASSVADSSSCVRDGTRWRALEAVVMRPLRLNKGLHCCHVKASYPRRAILHKERSLHDYAPQTRSDPVVPSLKQTLDSDNHLFYGNITVPISHMRIFISGFIASWESPTVIYKNSNGR